MMEIKASYSGYGSRESGYSAVHGTAFAYNPAIIIAKPPPNQHFVTIARYSFFLDVGKAPKITARLNAMMQVYIQISSMMIGRAASIASPVINR